MRTHKYLDADDIPEWDVPSGRRNILVFGSNVDGWHGGGVALIAKEKWGAIYRNPFGRQGLSFAIRTKDLKVKVHPSVSAYEIIDDINALYVHAAQNVHENFIVPYTAVGLNLNFYSPQDMANMFTAAGKLNGGIPDNVIFEEGFSKLMEKTI